MILFPREDEFEADIQGAAELYAVEPELIKAIIAQESGFNPDAMGLANDAGLMQVIPSTASNVWGRPVTREELLNPEFNIHTGTAYLLSQLQRYNGDMPSAIAAYNAGTAYLSPSGSFMSRSGNPSVQSYVTNVLRYYAVYKKKAPANLPVKPTPSTPIAQPPPQQPPSLSVSLSSPYYIGTQNIINGVKNMNVKDWVKLLFHGTVIPALAAVAASLQSGQPITARNILFPAALAGLAGLIGLFQKPPSLNGK